MLDTCGHCGNQRRWWTSRRGYRVCMICAPDPWEALETLARRAGGVAVARVQQWRGATAVAQAPRLDGPRHPMAIV
jgi:hypothetical protein